MDDRYREALGIVERDLYARVPCVLTDDDLPQLTGHARRLVAVVMTWWRGEMEAGRARLLATLGPRSIEYLGELPPEDRERALEALVERWMVAPAGPIAPWAAIGLLFGALLDSDRRAAGAALEGLAPGLLARLRRRLEGATRSEQAGAEALSAAMAAGAAVVLDERSRGEVVPDVAAAIAERIEAEAVAGALPPGWTRTRDGLDVATEPEQIATLPAGADEADLLAALDSEREEHQLVERLRAAGLTEAELALALRLASGEAESLAEAARLLGRGDSTARNQARAIRDKLRPKTIRSA
ncbi:MAG: hypothetical protein OZ948_19620 [Deltaproteobacteria bacterium]|nr:hypothetical protein [Deltaproteobacteria bacterium]